MTTQHIDVYSEMSQYEHIRKRTDMYMGSDELIDREDVILNYDQIPPTISSSTIRISEAVIRPFIEAIGNAGDNVERSKEKGILPGIVRITFTDSTITVKNNGLCIPIEKKAGEDVYISEKIFGQLLTSSNYKNDSPRLLSGKFGIGIKLCNIFSTTFEVTIENVDQKKRLYQKWENRMLIKHEPIISDFHGDESSVEISYALDFERFGLDHYSVDTDRLFARFVGDMALSCKVPVYFNNHLLPFDSIENYGKINLNIVDEPYTIYTGIKGYDDKMPTSSYEAFVAYTPDNSRVFSFVNGIMTLQGGVHVTSFYKTLSIPILAAMASKKANDIRLTYLDIQQHLSLILNCRLPDPNFNGQTKSALMSPTPSFKLSNIKKILSWGILELLETAVDAKQARRAKLSDGKKTKYVSIDKGFDANDAGGPNSHKCILELCEGQSAEQFITYYRNFIPNGNDTIGVYPLKGKFMNVSAVEGSLIERKRALDLLNENKEYKDIKKLIGLQEDIDYEKEENRLNLRYHKIRFRFDADDDGKHIAGLLLLLFSIKYPGLIKAGLIEMAYTPIKRATKGSKKVYFLTENEFLAWKKSCHDADQWDIKYFKGLGSNEKSDIRESLPILRNIVFDWDKESKNSLMKVFYPSRIMERKKWILAAKNKFNLLNGTDQVIAPVFDIQTVKSQDISHFLNNEMIYYSIMNMIRSIPRLTDGLKESQRKALYAGIKCWSTNGNYKKKFEEMKVSQFSGNACLMTKYKHSEEIMSNNIKHMAMNFVGANNLAWFEPIGMFGSRLRNGQDAAASRYLYTKLAWWIQYVFKSDDFFLHKLIRDEGEEIEPETLFPILPTILINGATGIATGWSTFIPNYNPLDIIQWIKCKLKNLPLPDNIVPWYRNFKGTIRIEKNKCKSVETEDYEDIGMKESVFITKGTKTVMVCEGIKRCIGSDIKIDELPIGTPGQLYYEYLGKLRENRMIRDFKDDSNETTLKYSIINARALTDNDLKLKRTFGLSNMVLLSEKNYPVNFEDVYTILEEFYKWRLPYYILRRSHYMDVFEKKLDAFDDRRLLIQLISNGTIPIMNRSKKDILVDLEKNGIKNPKIYNDISLTSFSKENVAEDENKRKQLEDDYLFYKNNTAESLWEKDLALFEKEYVSYHF